MKGLLLLLAVAAHGADPDDYVRELGDRNPVLRQRARTRLLAMGERAWPALELAIAAGDPEVAGTARRILRSWGWLPPGVRGQVSAEQRRAIFGHDGKARLAAVVELRKSGVEALRCLFAAAPATFAVEPASSQRTFFELAPALEFRVRNDSPHPGWAPPTIGQSMLADWRSFGRPVVFPSRKKKKPDLRRRFRTKRRLLVTQSTLVEQTEWVLPGAYSRLPRRQQLVAQDPGVATFLVGETITSYRAGAAVALMTGASLSLIKNPLPFDVPIDCARQRVTLNLLPREALWGKEADGARVRIARDAAGRVVLRLDSRFVAHAPRDFGSAWYVGLDDRGEIVAHGPLDGGDPAARTYTTRDLMFVPRPPDAAERAFALPELPPGTARLVAGVQLTRGRYPGGYTAVSNALTLR